MNLLSIAKTFNTENEALDFLIKQRWPKGVRCLACECKRVYVIETVGKTKKQCRLFECGDCKLHFSATTGTLFHDSHLPLQKWFMAMALMGEAKKGISANQVARHIGVTYKTAWYLCHRIRKAMADLSAAPIGGEGKIIEIDETFIGGKTKGKGVKAGFDAKVKVIGIAERGGRVHLQRLTDSKLKTLRPIFEAKIDPKTKKVVTDGAVTYDAIFQPAKHEARIHKDELWGTGTISAKTIEGAFSLFKRGVIGSYHHLSKDHMDSYLQEFCWRYNRRKQQPEMFKTLLGELVSNKPFTYKKLTRETF
jgi:transposase-like protein